MSEDKVFREMIMARLGIMGIAHKVDKDADPEALLFYLMQGAVIEADKFIKKKNDELATKLSTPIVISKRSDFDSALIINNSQDVDIVGGCCDRESLLASGMRVASHDDNPITPMLFFRMRGDTEEETTSLMVVFNHPAAVVSLFEAVRAMMMARGYPNLTRRVECEGPDDITG